MKCVNIWYPKFYQHIQCLFVGMYIYIDIYAYLHIHSLVAIFNIYIYTYIYIWWSFWIISTLAHRSMSIRQCIIHVMIFFRTMDTNSSIHTNIFDTCIYIYTYIYVYIHIISQWVTEHRGLRTIQGIQGWWTWSGSYGDWSFKRCLGEASTSTGLGHDEGEELARFMAARSFMRLENHMEHMGGSWVMGLDS